MTARTLRRPAELVEVGLAPPERLPELEAVAERYAVAITPTLAGLIDPEDPADPIARQFLPDAAELTTLPEESADPIGDGAHEVVPGLIHRYPDRVLLKLVRHCAVYCRFCFRRETVGPGQPTALSGDALEKALSYIAGRPEIWEVVVTGGDPLVLSPRRVAALGRQLQEIEHVRIVRWHSRIPVVAPERIDKALVDALKIPRKATYVVIHCNHARELTSETKAALARLADSGIPLLSQSVLLRGVNDDPQVLADLLRGLVENRVKPYYLHHGDLAPGTSHFRTEIAEGQAVMRALRGRVSGLCQPTYVLDIPGGHGKVPIGPSYLTEAPNRYLLEDIHGCRHDYPLTSAE